jgi:chromosome segregation ATPase
MKLISCLPVVQEGLGKANDRATMLEKELGEIKIRAEEYSSSELAVKAELEKAQAQFSANENEMKQTIAQLQADLTAAKKVEQERDELSGAIKSLEVELGIAKQSAEDLADAQLLNQELAQATSALETELMTVKQDAETVKDAETALRAQLAEASKALKDSEQKEEQMRLSVSRLEADLEVTQTAAGAEESAKLREMADRVAELESKLAAESMDKQATAAQMTRDVKAADSRAASELKRSEELQMTLGKLETELKAVQEEKVELRTSAAADVAKLRSELAEARSLEKEVQEELTNVKSQLKAAQAQVGDRQEVRQTSSIATPASPAPAPQVPELAVAPQISVKPSVVLPSEVKVENAVPPKPQEAPESAAPMPAPPVASQELSTSQLMKKTVAELRELCKLAGVATTGKKRDLVDKLIQT